MVSGPAAAATPATRRVVRKTVMDFKFIYLKSKRKALFKFEGE
jgi:hypothetical protein